MPILSSVRRTGKADSQRLQRRLGGLAQVLHAFLGGLGGGLTQFLHVFHGGQESFGRVDEQELGWAKQVT